MNRASLLVTAVLFAVFTAACASGASVGQLKTNPGRYVDKEVTVHGTVTSSWGIPLVPLKMYQVDDGTGEILVVSDENRLPSKGARVKVTGKVSEFAVLGRPLDRAPLARTRPRLRPTLTHYDTATSKAWAEPTQAIFWSAAPAFPVIVKQGTISGCGSTRPPLSAG